MKVGNFHGVKSVAATPNGVSVTDVHNIEYFIHMFPAHESIPLRGGFGAPPEEDCGFQYIEGLQIPAVIGVEITPYNNHEEFEVREMNVRTEHGDLQWHLFLPH